MAKEIKIFNCENTAAPLSCLTLNELLEGGATLTQLPPNTGLYQTTPQSAGVEFKRARNAKEIKKYFRLDTKLKNKKPTKKPNQAWRVSVHKRQTAMTKAAPNNHVSLGCLNITLAKATIPTIIKRPANVM